MSQGMKPRLNTLIALRIFTATTVRACAWIRTITRQIAVYSSRIFQIPNKNMIVVCAHRKHLLSLKVQYLFTIQFPHSEGPSLQLVPSIS
jgi:hypothetical protein